MSLALSFTGVAGARRVGAQCVEIVDQIQELEDRDTRSNTRRMRGADYSVVATRLKRPSRLTCAAKSAGSMGLTR